MYRALADATRRQILDLLEVWPCVEIPGSAVFFGTGRTVRVDADVDGVHLANVGDSVRVVVTVR
ncbi:hypothetical protein [Microbacterium caowuchunii]|uniref:hypothetical protein n=1 Tax=Microbacterium caowuchunii TaxID=2614638 RepID=UPI001EE85B88|nr:hypothetical protein [Microbacterium caowuchunii]